MVLQESVNLLRLSVVVQVHSDPLVTLRQWVWLLLNLFNCLALDRLVELGWAHQFRVLGDRFLVPEFMDHEKTMDLLELADRVLIFACL